MKDLILVESPTKAKTLTRFLNGKYEIQASFGHVRDLPKGDMGVDIEHNFEPKYVIPTDKRKIVEGLKSKAKGATRIILATDPDREGEAIAHHLYTILKDNAKKAKFDRIAFHEITQKAINEALEHPRTIDENLVSAQTARRVLDRIVGYKLSPVLWKKIRRGLSAGRVQSIALRLIVEREKEIEKFSGKTFYRVFVLLSKQKEKSEIDFELVSIDKEKIEKSEKINLYDGDYTYKYTTLDKNLSNNIEQELKSATYTVTNLIQKDTKRSANPPFTTSTLQQEAFRRLSFSSKKTMSVAQRLYEEGFITYHRTDSFNLSNDFITSARGHIEKTFGKEYLSHERKVFKTKSKMAQEAHEAIRPTSTESQEQTITATLGRDFARLYLLVYKRAIATQMADAIYASTKIEVTAQKTKTYIFEANGKVLKFPGFLKMWYYEENDQILPEITIGEILDFLNSRITEHTTNPPPRYNEASIVASLEKHGIGRPSTYAPIISTLYTRQYIERQEGRITSTSIGVAVSDFLVKNFSAIDDIPFTSSMEDSLDMVAEGKEKWEKVLKDFYGPFEKTVTEAEGIDRVKIEDEMTDKICPKDGGQIVIKRGKFGKFYACTNFPNCDYTAPYVEETNYTCPKDGGQVIVKKTRKGRNFFGCSNYPKCDFAVWNKQQLEKAIAESTKSSASNQSNG